MEDSEILLQLSDRKQSAIENMLSKYGKLCKQIAGNMLKSHEDVEEVVNDTLLMAWNRIPPETPNYLGAFLCKIARNLSLKKIEYNTADKRQSNLDALPLDELAETLCTSQESPEEKTDAAELGECISEFLFTQKQVNRKIFMRRYFAGESVKQIAEEFDMSENNVSGSLLRTRKKLAEYLKENGFSI